MPKCRVTLVTPTYRVYEIEIEDDKDDFENRFKAEELIWSDPANGKLISKYEKQSQSQVYSSELMSE